MVSAVLAHHGHLSLGLHRLEARIVEAEEVVGEEDAVPQAVEEEERVVVVGAVAEIPATAAAKTNKQNKTDTKKLNRAKIANSRLTPISFGIALISEREGLIFRVSAVNRGIGLVGRNYLEMCQHGRIAVMILHNIQRLRKKPRWLDLVEPWTFHP